MGNAKKNFGEIKLGIIGKCTIDVLLLSDHNNLYVFCITI
jgi:hypothetical protein